MRYYRRAYAFGERVAYIMLIVQSVFIGVDMGVALLRLALGVDPEP